MGVSAEHCFYGVFDKFSEAYKFLYAAIKGVKMANKRLRWRSSKFSLSIAVNMVTFIRSVLIRFLLAIFPNNSNVNSGALDWITDCKLNHRSIRTFWNFTDSCRDMPRSFFRPANILNVKTLQKLCTFGNLDRIYKAVILAKDVSSKFSNDHRDFMQRLATVTDSGFVYMSCSEAVFDDVLD